MRVAITGAGGQLGQTLARRFGTDAIALGRADLDLRRPDQIASVLEQLRPNVVINAAAYTQVERAETEPEVCFQVNALGVQHLAETSAALGAYLVHLSTDYVFGGDRARRTPYAETDSPAPLSVYGRAKLAGERAAATCPRHLIVRTCGLYGSKTPRTSFVETMLRLGREHAHVRVVHDQTCTPSYVEDVATAIRALVAAQAQGIYHVTNAGSTSWYEFAQAIFRLARLPGDVEPISSAAYGALAERPAYSVLDTTRYSELLGTPPRAWEEALAEFLQARLADS